MWKGAKLENRQAELFQRTRSRADKTQNNMVHYSALKINTTTLVFLEGVCCLAAYGKIGLENEQSLSRKPISFYQSTH